MHYSTLTILPILALAAITSAVPVPIEAHSSIVPPIKTSDSDAVGAPILPKRSFADPFAVPIRTKRSIKSLWDDVKDGDYVIT